MNQKVWLAMVLAALTVVSGCTVVPPTEESPDPAEIDNGLKSYSTFPAMKNETVVLGEASSNATNEAGYPGPIPGVVSKVYKYRATAAFDEMAILNPASDIYWLGSVFDASTIEKGTYLPIMPDRHAESSFALTLVANNGGSVRGTFSSQSEYNEARSKIIAQGTTPAVNSTSYFQRIYNEQQFKMAIGANVNVSIAGIEGSAGLKIDWTSSSNLTRYIIKYIDVMYTANLDLPGKPSQMFASDVSWNELKSGLSGTLAPVYISSIKYGRMALFYIESAESDSKVKAALNAAVSYKGIKGSTELDAETVSVLNSCTIQAVTVGGASGTLMTGIDDVVKYATNGNSDPATAAPIAYTLRYLHNNEIASVPMASEYYVRSSSAVYTNYKLTLVKFWMNNIPKTPSACLPMTIDVSMTNSQILVPITNRMYNSSPLGNDTFIYDRMTNGVFNLTMGSNAYFSVANPEMVNSTYLTFSLRANQFDFGGSSANTAWGNFSKVHYLTNINSYGDDNEGNYILSGILTGNSNTYTRNFRLYYKIEAIAD